MAWYDQVTPHDVRDYDFQATPVLVGELVVGAGKAGRVIGWDRTTHRRRWTAQVGLHRNDVGPLPRRRVTVCPGLLGGATSYAKLDEIDPTRGRGRLVALDLKSGRRLWERRFPSPDFGCATVANDVVFTATYDGTVYGLRASDGRFLWGAKLRAGINACPAVAGDLLLVGAGVPQGRRSVPELVAFSLGSR